MAGIISAGIDPAPRRAGPTWREFLTAQAHAIIACDFLVVETVLLQRLYVLVFIEHGTRRFTSDHLVRPDPLRYGITRSGQVQVASQSWPSRNRGVFSDDSHDRSRT